MFPSFTSVIVAIVTSDHYDPADCVLVFGETTYKPGPVPSFAKCHLHRTINQQAGQGQETLQPLTTHVDVTPKLRLEWVPLLSDPSDSPFLVVVIVHTGGRLMILCLCICVCDEGKKKKKM